MLVGTASYGLVFQREQTNNSMSFGLFSCAACGGTGPKEEWNQLLTPGAKMLFYLQCDVMFNLVFQICLAFKLPKIVVFNLIKLNHFSFKIMGTLWLPAEWQKTAITLDVLNFAQIPICSQSNQSRDYVCIDLLVFTYHINKNRASQNFKGVSHAMNIE